MCNLIIVYSLLKAKSILTEMFEKRIPFIWVSDIFPTLLSDKHRVTVSSQTIGEQISKPFDNQTKTERYSSSIITTLDWIKFLLTKPYQHVSTIGIQSRVGISVRHVEIRVYKQPRTLVTLPWNQLVFATSEMVKYNLPQWWNSFLNK